jgi:hypothetical protein
MRRRDRVGVPFALRSLVVENRDILKAFRGRAGQTRACHLPNFHPIFVLEKNYVIR